MLKVINTDTDTVKDVVDTSLNQKLSSNRDAVEMLNNYVVWTCV